MNSNFIIRRFIHDFAKWEKTFIEHSYSSMTSTNEMMTHVTSENLTGDRNSSVLATELSVWMDVTMDEMVITLRKLNMDVKHVILFLKENQDRYFDRSHLVKCENKHVLGSFPIDDGIDGGKGYCPYCEMEVELPRKMHQQVVYNWKISQ